MKNHTVNKMIPGLVLLILVLAVMLPAHRPKAIKISLVLDSGELKVVVRHPVKNTLRHYIKRIRVLVNDQKVIDTRYEKQTAPENHTAGFSLKGIRSGDEIVVKASCNRFGGKKARITAK
jgi:desulfoferrodoxin (superoxide reductase-like protein)